MKNTVPVYGKLPRWAALPAFNFLYFEKQPIMSLLTTLLPPFQKRYNAFALLLFFGLLTGLSHAQTIRYVKPTAAGAGDGSSWDNASADLQAMINETGTEQVWVAKGTYKPGTSRYASFSMKAGVKIYGSFAGTETNLSGRTAAVMAANKSILSGDLNGDDVITGSGATLSITNNGENCYHVVYNDYDGRNRLTTDNSLLDGFTITGGNANGESTSSAARGGGMYNASSSPNLTNIIFSGNNAGVDGGGLHNNNSFPSLSNGTFEKNQANKGGGINGTTSSPVLNNVLFKGNKASAGGGMYNFTTFTPTLTNVIFKENKADGDGGGICNYHGNVNLNSVYFIDNQASYGGGMYDYYAYGNRNNVVFSGNIASENGGGIYSSNLSYATFSHVTFTGNQATNGGGIFNNNEHESSILYKNGIFWGNTATGTGPDIKNNLGNIRLNYCSLQLESSNYSGGFTLEDGMRYAQNPLFVNAADPDGADNVFGTSDDGLRLSPCSPVINAGTNAGAASTDIIGNPRSFGGTVDMGAYESQAPPVTGTRLYVNAAAAANGDGSSWATAYTDLQTALTNARLCSQITEIWVAKGTYKPGTSRNASFSMKAGVKIYGSFAGTETNLSERTAAVMAANKSILSGDLNGDDATTGKGENSYHVILNDNNGLTTSNSLLDGFTITGGNASEDSGGGMYNKSSSPSIVNCSFLDNEAPFGGGIGNDDSSPSLANCSFSGNWGYTVGGGMYNFSESSPSLVNCIFLGNQAVYGGGMGNVINCRPSLVNCSFSGNMAIFKAGGIYNDYYSPPSLKNCILWGNKHEFGSYNEVESSDSESNPTYTNTLVEGLAVGGFQGTENPLFINQPSAGHGTSGDLRLQACSPVLNAGNNADNSTTVDLGGNNRKVGTIDLGAYEYQSAPPAVVTPTVSVSHPTTCGGTEGSIRLSGFLKTITYSVTYEKNNVSVSAANFTSDGSGVITLPNLGAGSYTDIVATYGACVSNAVTPAVVLTDPTKPTATISGTTTVCQNSTSPSITFTGQSGTGAYTFTYKINEGTSQAVTTTSGNIVTVPVSTGTVGGFTYHLESVSTPNNCNQEQVSSVVVTVNPQPVGPTLNTKTPNVAAVCFGTAVSATFNAGSGGVGCSDDYVVIIDGGSPVAYSSGSWVGATATNSIVIQGRRANCGLGSGCNSTEYVTLASWTVSPQPVGPSLNTKTPNVAAICKGTNVSATFTAGSGGVGCSDDYVVIIDSGSPVAYTSGTLVGATANSSIVIQGRRANCSANSGCNGTSYVTLASWNVNPIPTASISGSATVCKDSPSPSVTFTGNNGTAPYTFTYQINNGSNQTVLSGSGNSITVPQSTANTGVFTYTLLQVSDANGCSQAQNGSAVVKVIGKPTFNLTTQQTTLNEGNNQIFCDTDDNSVNSLQFTVLSSCVMGNPVWRVQAGSGAWSNWSSTSPVSQPSDNQSYRYQAACDANCASTYSGVIEVKINYRASTPQNVSLAADGVSVKEGETKEVCNQEGDALNFNATCGVSELLLYSVDGGNYSTVVPTQWVDGQYHNYRVRCRKADNTPSCVETESGVMRLRITSLSQVPVATLNVTSGCGTPVAFSGTATCGSLTTLWYNATANAALSTLPVQTPNETASYYARCLAEGGCLSEKSNVVTYTVIPVSTAPIVTASAEVVCTGTEVTISTTCPTGTTPFWNTGATESSFKVAFSNVTRQSYWVRCTYSNGCQSAESVRKEILWKAFELTFINIGQSRSATKTNDRAAWASQFITPDGGPSLEFSTQANPTLFFSEKVNKTAPRFWTIHAETCNLGTDGSLTFDMLATPELGVIRSYNTHENNAPYFMYANRAGFTELYAQNHPLYGFFADNGNGGNVYDEGLPKGLYKLGVRYWDQKGQGSIYPSTRQPASNVLAYQEYWFRIQSQNGVGTGSARISGEQKVSDNDTWIRIGQNPVLKEIEIQLSGTSGEEIDLSLVNLQGQTLQQKSLKLPSSQHLEVLNIEKSAAGMYILKAVKGNKSQTFKIIKTE